MILGIGVDIVHLPRIAFLTAKHGRERLARRILSNQEHVEFQQISSNDENVDDMTRKAMEDRYLSSRWCVKEAVYKALYPVHKLEWKQVTLSKAEGKPRLLIENCKIYGIGNTHVSLSHDGEYAIAQVILEKSEQNAC